MNLKEAKGQLADLITHIMNIAPDEGNVWVHKINADFVSFSREDLRAGLVLTDEDATQYRQVVNEIYDQATAKVKYISRVAVESFIQIAMLKAIDPSQIADERDFGKRLDSALAELEQELRAEPSKWEVHFPVQGLELDKLPFKFGKCTFYFADADFVEALPERLRVPPSLLDVTGDRGEFAKGFHEFIAGKTAVLTSVEAVDAGAAKLLAQQRVRQTVDILSFYANLRGQAHSRIIVFDDPRPGSMEAFAFAENRGGYSTREHVGPVEHFSFATDYLEKLFFTKASAILEQEKLSGFQQRLVSALQWAGRASVTARKEEAFLLFAIALESLVMERGDKTEITETLALRVAHIVAIPQGRLKLYHDIKKLYRIRSNIVHAGDMKIGEADLSLMRFVVRMALLTMLGTPRFSKIVTDTELTDWFRVRLLDIPQEQE